MEFTKPKRLLSVSADPKTVKGEKNGVLTGILYLAPHNLSGFQVCPKASEGCKLACLFTAGRGIYVNTQQSRINKTRWFFLDRASFLDTLVKDIKRVERKAARMNMVPAIRLNGTSDLPWEKIKVLKDGAVFRNIMEAFPNVTFYDYTKILGRDAALAQPNYHLTFSLSESNDAEARQALNEGYNVAAVFKIGRKAPKPITWGGFKVLDGDSTDLRFLDGTRGHIIGLAAKGKARRDTSGFVRSVSATLN